MYATYQAGATLREVADRWDIDIRTVRRAFQAAGLLTRSAAQSRHLTASRRQAQFSEEVLRRFAELRNVERTAKVLSVSPLVVRRRLKREGLGGLAISLIERRLTRGPRWDAKQILELLHDAVAGRQTLTTMVFDQIVLSRPDLGWPRAVTVIRRFGSWEEALRAAGLATALSPLSRPVSVYSRADCVEALRAAVKALGRVSSEREYAAFAARAPGKTPSLGTIVLRLGSWRSALLAAGIDELILEMALAGELGDRTQAGARAEHDDTESRQAGVEPEADREVEASEA
jgi:hypothetical protein